MKEKYCYTGEIKIMYRIKYVTGQLDDSMSLNNKLTGNLYKKSLFC